MNCTYSCFKTWIGGRYHIIPSTIVLTRINWMGLRQCVEVGINVGEAEGAVATIKVLRIRCVLEESSSGSHVEGSLSGTTINEEAERENGFGIGGEDTRRKEGEVGVSRNRILNTVPTDLQTNKA